MSDYLVSALYCVAILGDSNFIWDYKILQKSAMLQARNDFTKVCNVTGP